MTASEELSIEEEYENQKSWHIDPKSLTYIYIYINNNILF